MAVVVLLLVLGVALFGAAGWFAIFGAARDERRRRDHENNADEVAARLFDGSPAVTYAAPDTSGGLSIETLVAKANEHGYRLVSETGRMFTRRVVFERRQT